MIKFLLTFAILMLPILYVYVVMNKNKILDLGNLYQKIWKTKESFTTFDKLEQLGSKSSTLVSEPLDISPEIRKLGNYIIGKFNTAPTGADSSVDRPRNIESSEIITRIWKILPPIYEKSSKYTGTLGYEHFADEIAAQVGSRLFHDTTLEMNVMTKLLIAQFLTKKSKLGQDVKDSYEYMIAIAGDRSQPPLIRSNAADMLILSNNTKYRKLAVELIQDIAQQELIDDAKKSSKPSKQKAKQMIQEIKRHVPVQTNFEILPTREEIEVQQILFDQIQNAINVVAQTVQNIPTNENKTIYQDTQIVHDTSVNNSVLEAAKTLIEEYPEPRLSFDMELIKNLGSHDKEKINISLQRIYADSSTLKYGITLNKIFSSLLEFINSHPEKQELEKRLIQELIEMSGSCCTGHMSRMINVLQGYTSNKVISVNIDSEVYATVSSRFSTDIATPQNIDVLENMMEDQPEKQTLFHNYLTSHFDSILQQLVSEYSSSISPEKVRASLVKAINKYANYQVIKTS